VTGAPYSAERLRELSETLRLTPSMANLYEGDADDAVAALRAFARVVSALALVEQRGPDALRIGFDNTLRHGFWVRLDGTPLRAGQGPTLAAALVALGEGE
jgi:hypothetical protein